MNVLPGIQRYRQSFQLKQLKAVSREKERKMAEKLRRREERKRAKLNQRLKEKNVSPATNVSMESLRVTTIRACDFFLFVIVNWHRREALGFTSVA